VWTVIAVTAILPDIDAIGRPFGLGDLALFGGHRALTHSLTAAAVLSFGAAHFLRRRSPPSRGLGRLWLALFLAAATHGLLDTLTDYGQGVALLAPWADARVKAWPLLSGFGSDFLVFASTWFLARLVIQRRGWPLPRALAGRRQSGPPGGDG
jgi:inner membrane protein